MKPPPTPQESMDIAAEFLRIAEVYAVGDDEAAWLALCDFTTSDNETAFLNTWYLAGIGPIIAAAGLRKLNKGKVPAGAFWGLVQVPGRQMDQTDPNVLAVLRAVTAYLNDDEGAAHDVTSVHFDTAGFEGLIAFVCEALKLCAFLWRQGAFG